MGLFSRFERHVEDGFEGAADKMFDAPISPVQISKKAEKAMRREKMVGAGKQYAPTLYTVLVNPQDDQRLFGYYPTLAGETETYLAAKASEDGLLMDGQPLVRFIVDDDLKRGKFDIIAEMVSAPIIQQLRDEEMNRYGLGGASMRGRAGVGQPQASANRAPQQNQAPQGGYDQFSRQGRQPAQEQPYQQPMPQQAPAGEARFTPSNVKVQQPAPAAQPVDNAPLPYVPEDEIDRSLDYGEYTFNSEDFQDASNRGAASQPGANPYAAQAPATAAPTTAFNASANAAAPYQQPQPQQPVNASLTNMVTNQPYRLSSNSVLMGRGTDCDISINDINASRRHCELTFQPPSSWVITDLNSTNGTKLNGQRVTAETLREGDRITVGMTNFLFSYQQ